jgi:hypothetical protein
MRCGCAASPSAGAAAPDVSQAGRLMCRSPACITKGRQWGEASRRCAIFTWPVQRPGALRASAGLPAPPSPLLRHHQVSGRPVRPLQCSLPSDSPPLPTHLLQREIRVPVQAEPHTA